MALEWNPHIHCLISEGGFSDDGFWKKVIYFNYTYLRKAFQTVLLNELEAKIGPDFDREYYFKDRKIPQELKDKYGL